MSALPPLRIGLSAWEDGKVFKRCIAPQNIWSQEVDDLQALAGAHALGLVGQGLDTSRLVALGRETKQKSMVRLDVAPRAVPTCPPSLCS